MRHSLSIMLGILGMVLAVPVWAQAPSEALEEGRRLYFAGDYAGAEALWRPLAEAGDPRAMYNMATLYRRGLGVEKDEVRADALLRGAAEKGFAEAQYLLAERGFTSAGADEARRQEAVGWWLAAARQGHAPSQYRLGLLYWNGDAVARDLVTGRAWMALAGGQGIEDASKALETMDRYLTEEQRARAESLSGRLLASAEDSGVAAASSSSSGPSAEPAATASSPSSSAPPAVPPPTRAVPVRAAAMPFDEGWRLQIVALRERDAAEAVWSELMLEAPDLVEGLEHRVAVADLGERGVYHRLQIGPFASREAAENRCRALKAAGHGCFPVSPDS